MSGPSVLRRACRACCGGGDTVVAPTVHSRAEHLGRRATSAALPKVLRGRTYGGHRCVQDGISRFEVVARQPRRHGSRIGGNRSSAATSGMVPPPKPAWSGTRSRHDGGRRAAPLKTSVLLGKPKRAPAYPTDRMLGETEPGRSSPGSRGSWWQHEELSQDRAGRGGVPLDLAPTVHRLSWSPVDFLRRLSAARLSLLRVARVGCQVHLDARIQVCFGARQADRFPTFELARRRREGSFRTGGDTGEGSGRSVRSCRESLRRMTRVAGQTLYAR
jgi:hypothetical protein